MAPNIIEYNATSDLTPSDRGIDAAEIAGRRLGVYYDQIGEAVKGVADKVEQHMGVLETNELYKTGTELEFNLNQSFAQQSEQAQKNGGYDPHFADQFMANVGPVIDKWAAGATTDRGKQLAAEMGAQIRANVFRKAAAGQAAMDLSHFETNDLQTLNHLSASLIDDPSDTNYEHVVGVAEGLAREGVAHFSDVEMREQAYTQRIKDFLPELTVARYRGMALAAKNQIGETGDETKSPALKAFDDATTKREGFDTLLPTQQVAILEMHDEAVRQGQELFKSKDATAKAQMTEQGKQAFSDIHTVITELAIKGQGPTPDVLDAIGKYARIYGATNPGEVASLNDFALRGQDRAEEGKVQSYNQQTRDNIQTSFGLPAGDPRRPTLASITQAYSHGQITAEDFNRYSEILKKLDKPSTDPAFKPAWENFRRWQDQMVQSIGNKGYPGTSAARAQFLHDSTAAFMSQGQGGVSWDKALDGLTSAQNPHSFVHVMKFYQDAATKGPQWLQQHDQFYANPHGTPALGSSAAPIVPTKSAQPTKMDQKEVDAILWGNQ